MKLKSFETNGFNLEVTEDTVRTGAEEVKISKRITCGKVPPYIVVPLLNALKQYAQYEEKDVLISRNGGVSFPVAEFLRPLPKFISLWKGLKEIRVTVHATGYALADVVKFKQLPKTGNTPSVPSAEPLAQAQAKVDS